MRSVALRVTLLAATSLAASVAVAVALAYQLLSAAGRDHLDATLRREQAHFDLSVQEAREQPQLDDDARMRAAIEQYLRLNADSDAYFAMIDFNGVVRTSEVGPTELLHLAGVGQLPIGTVGRLETVHTAQGDVRVLTARVGLPGTTTSATFAVAGSLEEIRDDVLESIRLLALAGVVSTLAGSVVLAIGIRSTLAPLRSVASAAKATDASDLDTRVPEPRYDDEIAVLAREFNRMLDRLSNAAAARREFLASVSHELRTPLTIARGHLEIFAGLGEAEDGDLAHITNVLFDELRHMGRLVDDLMTLAHSEGQGFLQLRDVPVGAFFDDLRLRATGLDIEGLQLHEPPSGLVMHADPDRLAQAILNLVTNAHRHTPRGTIIDVSAREDGDALKVTVADNGPGVDPSIRDHMFDPFVTSAQAVSSAGGDHRPAGLGLAVVAAIVDAHHGAIAVDSDGSGTRIELRVPTG
jgi:two-component system OmpR family sensor kinase